MIAFTILGEPASKSNSRRLVIIGKRPSFIKSQKALDYEKAAALQIPASARQMLQGPLRVTIRVWYASERPDLDCSVILDVMQAKFEKVIDGYTKIAPGQYTKQTERRCVRKGVYLNDRQVREQHFFHAIDKANPRAEIEIEQLIEELPL
jgi:Holliday junction resolvase RusA-like endonuclease